ncbi:hypothetical protein Skr01_71120 [Sphaerisporangium krabiense]|uniref:Uncharacterized protein n=1 Tax=Sphaerisporangium krabiense TaxID=763782 RepID=A0A7W8Z8A2_9ACTN|nr:hypothetical protein [Sphaerisporangium krabiense]MBB5629254.1 hypothetical protein [Sphaerisporangium krabiense]GII67027.1 hypothetical protein Skr01_71120 [Sphaerisporangium krabiense]
MAEFLGLDPWHDEGPVVDFSTPTGIVDLHNNATVEQVIFAPREAVLRILFRYAEDWRTIDTEGRLVELEFREVRDLRIAQAADYDPRSSTTLEGLVHRLEGPMSAFEVDMGDITCSLLAGALTLHLPE